MLSIPAYTTAASPHPAQIQRAYTQQLHSQRGTRIPEPVSTGSNQPEPETGDQSSPDKVSLSPEALNRAKEQEKDQVNGNRTGADGEELSDDEQRVVEKLKQRDREVRAHEQTHLANAGQFAAGGPSFTYQRGPDGNQYAIGGEVHIDINKERSPEETIRKMQAVRRAALAPASPSGTDRTIAAAAARKEAEAKLELRQQETAESSDVQSPPPDDGGRANQSKNIEPAGQSISTLA